MSAQTTQEALNSALKDLQAWKAAALAAQVERDALAAQVEDLNDQRSEFHNLNSSLAAQVEVLHRAIYRQQRKEGWHEEHPLVTLCIKQPQHCLAEIKAQAGRAGYLAAVCDAHPYGYDTTADEQVADEYAESIRRGGKQ